MIKFESKAIDANLRKKKLKNAAMNFALPSVYSKLLEMYLDS